MADDPKPKKKVSKFKKRKRKRDNLKQKTITSLDDASDTGVKIPQLQSKLSEKRSKNALVSRTSDRAVAGSSYLDMQKSSRNAMPADTADKHIAVSIEHQRRSGKDKDKPKWVGPRKAPDNIRMTTIIDYNPSLCKDYNETGFCGYGDSCKFLHDRGDYKGGWQLEKEWQEKQERERKMLAGEEVSDEENYAIESDDELPFACYICRDDFKNPVVTRCGHHFCEACALKRYAKNKSCAACGANTNGIFKTAHKIIKKMKKMKEKEEQEAAEGGEDSDDEAQPADVKRGIAGAVTTGWTIPGGEGRYLPQKEV
eukprot:CAMPEP_0197521216 /NCGR_PEP_ID=MMETSP1318-20131121/6499_1 /TAXON_ID=552666 /ORGANISM="Partenskyella glossopodia, Strain RCC365" /LENGTH=311 /DNA_ID=CAMNT_0043073099 /DNA_START=5 /DNA_END=940 /DNA_ORIENTATION=+